MTDAFQTHNTESILIQAKYLFVPSVSERSTERAPPLPFLLETARSFR